MLLIAEAGVNHNGNFRTALELVDAAKNAGADAVKFQYFSSMKLWGDHRITNLELNASQIMDIYAYCKAVGIEFMCSAFGVEELEFLAPLLKRVKIPSGLVLDDDLFDAAVKTKLPILVSTGMSDANDIDHILERGYVNTLLQCTSSYPCRLEDVHLRGMQWLQDYTGLDVGLSDHTTSITVPIAATALGANVIEKHFTLDRSQAGPDHKASIMPHEFKAMRLAIIEVEAAMGDGVKRVLPCEEKLRKAWRK